MSAQGRPRCRRLMLGTAGFGNWIDEATAHEIVAAALARGIERFDTAACYGRSEEILGRALRGQNGALVATKISPEADLAPDRTLADQILRLLERSLTRIGRDRIDLLQVHDPFPRDAAPAAFALLADLKRQGVIGAIGLCNHDANALRTLFAVLPDAPAAAPVTLQNQHNLLRSDVGVEVRELCEERALAIWAWSPLAGGLLSGHYGTANPRPPGSRAARGDWLPISDIDAELPLLDRLRSRHGAELARFALDWTLQSPGVSGVVIGPANAAQLGIIGHLTPPLSQDLAATTIW